MQKVDTFRDSLKSKHTKYQYKYHLQRYFRHKRVSLTATDNNIVDYLMQMQREGLSYSYRNSALCAVKHYYVMNKLMLNWDWIAKFLGEHTFDNELRGYTREEIHRLIDIANIRYKALILLFASTGMRRAAATEIRLKDMKYLEQHKLYQIKIYPRSKEQQIVFTTPEAAQALDLYLRNRRENELVRLTPDSKLHGVSPPALSFYVRRLTHRSGMCRSHPETEKTIHGKVRQEIPAVHGLRKFAATQMGRSDMKVEAREILLGHSIGVRAAYQKYSDEDLLQEYLKAVDLLTINEENRLRKKVKVLEEKEDYLDKILKRVRNVEMQLNIKED